MSPSRLWKHTIISPISEARVLQTWGPCQGHIGSEGTWSPSEVGWILTSI
jgi:hypothetical protein